MTTLDENDVLDRIEQFLMVNFPQIAMHGGDSSVESVDMADGHAKIRLSGACSGCGISPMTVQAINNRLPGEIPGITTVEVVVGEDESHEQARTDVPF